jgi:hypothetical protein
MQEVGPNELPNRDGSMESLYPVRLLLASPCVVLSWLYSLNLSLFDQERDPFLLITSL